MNLRQMARILGRKGGLARARKLSKAERRRIASLGGLTRSLSRHAARRIRDNFMYVAAIEQLRTVAKQTALIHRPP